MCQEFSTIKCLHCEKEFKRFKRDDHYNYTTGDLFICPYCDEIIYIIATAELKPPPRAN